MTTREQYLHVRTLGRTDVDDIAGLLGRGMSDNPIHLAAYGVDESHVARRHTQMMRTLLAASPALRIEGVDRGARLVGVAAAAPPGRCQPSPLSRLRLAMRALSFGPRTTSRLLSWTGAWAEHDLTEPHVHLGPVAVDRHLRGQGIGSLLLLRHAATLDAVGMPGYLETDRPDAVGFYRRFGYVVVDEADVLGVPCWFMRRPAI